MPVLTDAHPPPPPPPDDLSPPPGYVGYGNAPTPLARVRPILGVSKALTIMTGVAGVATLVGGLLTPLAAGKAGDFLAGRISETDFQDSYAPFALAQLVALAATLTAWILTMIWMYRISSNVRAYGRETTWHPLFGVFGWLLPPAVLYVIPVLMLREQWKASTPENINDPSGWRRQPENSVLWVWWVLYGLVPLGFLFAQRDTLFSRNFGSTTTESIAEDIENAGAFGLASGAAQFLAALAWIMFVRQLAARHTTLTDERRARG